MNRRVVTVAVVLAILAASCGGEEPTIAEQLGESIFGVAPPVPDTDMAAATRGEAVYQANCAACHGPDLAGAPDWKVPGENGQFKPPPMDSTGHTWHHSDRLLIEIITNGSPDEASAMKGFGDRLSSEDIEAILAFFKSRWGPEERQFQWMVTWQEASVREGDR